jgi:hypothetical protein
LSGRTSSIKPCSKGWGYWWFDLMYLWRRDERSGYYWNCAAILTALLPTPVTWKSVVW